MIYYITKAQGGKKDPLTPNATEAFIFSYKIKLFYSKGIRYQKQKQIKKSTSLIIPKDFFYFNPLLHEVKRVILISSY